MSSALLSIEDKIKVLERTLKMLEKRLASLELMTYPWIELEDKEMAPVTEIIWPEKENQC